MFERVGTQDNTYLHEGPREEIPKAHIWWSSQQERLGFYSVFSFLPRGEWALFFLRLDYSCTH